jgi:DNA invertase Pin-like site-specific DNA recombinase
LRRGVRDHLSRNLNFITSVMESGVEFVATDNPHANKLAIHILAAVAEHEREAISERTKAALAAATGLAQELGEIVLEAIKPESSSTRYPNR